MSDRATLQAAIDSAGGGLVQLDAGVYELEMPIAPPGRRRAYAVLHLGNGELAGVGPATVLRFVGDAGGADWRGLEMFGGCIRDLTIDTSALTGTSEQTHAIRITGPAIGPRVERVTFDHPGRPGWLGGDAIQLVGYSDSLIVGARIRECTFARCDRSGVAIHSGAHDLAIEDCVFLDVGDQDIDGEGSGSNRDWLIARNTFRLGPAPQGDYAIQLHGVDGVRVTDCRLFGRGLFLINANRVTIDHNSIIRTTAASGVAAVQIDKASSDVTLHDNAITRAASAGRGHVIRAMPRDGAGPTRLTIRDNRLTQLADSDVIHVTGVVGLVADDNLVTYAGPIDRNYGLLVQGSPTTRADFTATAGNTWVGWLAGCVGVNGGYAGCGALHLTGNTALGPLVGLRVGNATPSTGPVTVSSNVWPPPVGITIPEAP